MDQNALRQSAGEITIANLRSLLKVQTELRDQAEQKAQEALVAFQDLLQTLAPEESEKLQRAVGGLDRLPFPQLADILRGKARQTISDLARLQRPQIEDAEAVITIAYTQNTLLRSELKRTKEQLAEAQAENVRLRSENEALKQTKGRKGETEPGRRFSRAADVGWYTLFRHEKGLL